MKHLLFYDIESTGVDPWACRIVELAMLKLPAEAPFEFGYTPDVFRLNPGIPIPADVTEVHGITDADVADAPSFRSIAAQVQEAIEDAVICGYNSRRFDTIILDRELRDAGCAGLMRLDGKIVHPEIDFLQIWHKYEPRTLAGAFARFLGGSPEGFEAHSAVDDVMHLPALMVQMEDLAKASLDPIKAMEQLCAASIPEGEVDRGGKFKRREDGVVVIDFGKHKGTAAARVPPDFYDWMCRNDFPEDSKAVARHYIELARKVR